jgi:hypothetical protein
MPENVDGKAHYACLHSFPRGSAVILAEEILSPLSREGDRAIKLFLAS